MKNFCGYCKKRIINPRKNQITCGKKECLLEHKKSYYYKDPKYYGYILKYKKTNKFKKNRKRYNHSPEHKEYMRLYMREYLNKKEGGGDSA